MLTKIKIRKKNLGLILLLLGIIFTMNILVVYAQEWPQTCGTLRSNEESDGKTYSDQCVSISLISGSLYLSKLPESFTFPPKSFTFIGFNQQNFSNPDGNTGPNGIPDPFDNTQQTADEDVLTVTDLRNNNGFQITISADTFIDQFGHTIPLHNLHIVTTYPTSSDLPDNPELLGNTQAGITYAINSQGTPDIADTVDTTSLVNRANTFKGFGTNFDPDNNGTGNPVVLMNTETSHVGSFSNAISFYIDIPGGLPEGNYGTAFTIDLSPV
jgi:hypothetical protein